MKLLLFINLFLLSFLLEKIFSRFLNVCVYMLILSRYRYKCWCSSSYATKGKLLYPQKEAGDEDDKAKRNGKSSVSTKRSRAAAIHNQSERVCTPDHFPGEFRRNC